MKRTPLNRVSKTQKSKDIAKCDVLWAKLVKARAGGICEQCGKPGKDAHHMAGRRRSALLRHDLRNGVYLCIGCHFHFHGHESHTLWEWMKENRLEDYEYIISVMNKPAKVYITDVLARLKIAVEVLE